MQRNRPPGPQQHLRAGGGHQYSGFEHRQRLNLATRNGNMFLNGADGSNGQGSSQRVFISTPGSLTLAANNLHLRGSVLRANGGAIKLTGTTGSLY